MRFLVKPLVMKARFSAGCVVDCDGFSICHPDIF